MFAPSCLRRNSVDKRTNRHPRAKGFRAHRCIGATGARYCADDRFRNRIILRLGWCLRQEDHGNGTYVIYTYDAAGELLDLVNYAPNRTVNSSFVYTYDDLGNRITETTLDGSWAGVTDE